MSQLIDGKKIARGIQDQTAERIAKLAAERGVKPGLGVILVGDDPASAVYVASKTKMCEKLGMHSVTLKFPAESPEEHVLRAVGDLNDDPTIHGILVQLPLPKHINTDCVIETISPWKDVDGLTPYSAGLLALGRPRFIPCTPYGILEIFQAEEIETGGREVVVLGRSNLVGRPIATLLSLKAKPGDATVTVCHSRSRDLASITRRADILIVAIGQAKFVRADMVKQGAVVIDVGIHRLPEEQGGGLCGDVDSDGILEVASRITPVPGGVGPMTIAMLMKNTLHAAQLKAQGDN